jgi:hypothetical protein
MAPPSRNAWAAIAESLNRGIAESLKRGIAGLPGAHP